MKLKFISEDALLDLKNNFDAYKQHYYEKDSQWFEDYLINSGQVIESNVEFEMPDLSFHEEYAISDRENVKHVYESFKHLTPAQATQERLWAGLSYLQFKDYTFYRLNSDIDYKNNRRINSALFFTQGQKRSLFVHQLARLWWVGYMTYDPDNPENPYWLTDFFSEKDFSARCVPFFSSKFTSNPAITKGILTALIKLRDQGVDIKRKHFTASTKYLNVIGGAMVLDMLEKDEVERTIYNHLTKEFRLDNSLQVNT